MKGLKIEKIHNKNIICFPKWKTFNTFLITNNSKKIDW